MKLRWLPLAAVLLVLTLFVSCTQSPTPSPTPSPTAVSRSIAEGADYISHCFPYRDHLAWLKWERVREDFIKWSPDGSQILFARRPKIYSVDAGGGLPRMVVDASWEIVIDGEVRGRFETMTSFDVSPEGKLAYSRCGDQTPQAGYQFLDGDRDGHIVLSFVTRSGHENYIGLEIAAARRHQFEIAVSNIDGTDVKKLTQRPSFSIFPAWSPDGSRVAYFGDRRPPADRILYTMAADGTDVRSLIASKSLVVRPPSWSPDGRHVAAVGAGLEEVYTVRSDGSGLTAIVTDALSAPSWDHDGQRIAVAVPDGEGGALLRTFAPDGSDPVTLASIVGADDLGARPRNTVGECLGV